MNSMKFQNQYASLDPIKFGTSTFWIVNEDQASAYIPIVSHSIELPGQKPSRSIFSTRNRIQVVLQSDSWDSRDELVSLCDQLENREITFGFNVNQRFVGTWKGQIYNEIPQLFGQMEPEYSWYLEFQLTSLIPQEIFLESSCGRSWFADIENQRENFFCTDEWMLEWFLKEKDYLPVGCYFENMNTRLTVIIELEADRCAIVVGITGDDGKMRQYYGWHDNELSSDLGNDLETVGELDVPVGAVLSHMRGLEVLQFIIEHKEASNRGTGSKFAMLKPAKE